MNTLLQNATNLGLKSRYSYLFWFMLIVLFNSILKIGDSLWGDADGVISGQLKYLHFDANILFLLFFTLSVYFKSVRINDINISKNLWIPLIILALVFRLLLASLGHNFDLESYEIVADAVLGGKNVYAETERYNYGPIWAYILALLRWVSNSLQAGQTGFHFAIVAVLFLGELFFYRLLYRHFHSNLLIVLLLFNPIILIIIGHHSQFDILAIGIAFSAYLHLKKNNTILSVLLLGLSLCIKHVMVFLPLILLFDSKIQLKNRLVFLIVPAILFLVSFLPFYSAKEEIKMHVFSYQFNNSQSFMQIFLDLILPGFIVKMGLFKIIPLFQGYKTIWLAFFPLLGFYLEKHCIQNRFFIYLIVMVATSLAVSEQYFLIPLAAIFVFRKNLFAWIYLCFASYYILFVSFNNTAKYFNLKSIGIAMEFEWYQIGFAQVQLCLILLLIQIMYRFRNNKNAALVQDTL